MYHRFSAHPATGKVDVETFRNQLAEIRKKYCVYPLRAIVKCLAQGRPVPDNAVVLTVDDGYEDFYLYAWPILNSMNIPATVYVTSRFIEGQIWLWPDRLHHILMKTNRQQLSTMHDGKNITYRLEDAASRQSAWYSLNRHMMKLHPKLRNLLLDELGEELAVKTDIIPQREYSAMSWVQLREMAAGGITIGAHSRNHPVLSTLPRSEAEDEIKGCKVDIESILGMEIRDFCYPNGQPGDFTEETSALVMTAGYSNAVTAFHDRHPTTNIYALRRYGVGGSLYMFKKSLYGIDYLSDCLPV